MWLNIILNRPENVDIPIGMQKRERTAENSRAYSPTTRNHYSCQLAYILGQRIRVWNDWCNVVVGFIPGQFITVQSTAKTYNYNATQRVETLADTQR